jgi:uncharacterized protein (TIGR00288 family)
MIPSNARRGIHQSNPAFAVGQPYHPAPNAALLIDFDNVTLGIQKDLGKELKTLLNSDVIRGKVAVQRAYADWRRYPQYIVPLAESSIDLIFAPAYGPGKKNATDLRMAIDAMELVFIRPEIGTFILLTGDSDFSSCVLKLKEYGKYVIGVGMRESSSDLLIQNCDEYYSYHALSGLTRATESTGSTEDPWVLVRRAAEQMVRAGDVMRTDRLKQVMIDLDPGFDEKQIGYSKFSKFVSEAVTRGIIRVRRGENGQQEIVYEAEAGAAAGTVQPSVDGAAREAVEHREPRERDRDRGRTRDRHGRRRDRRGDEPRPEREPGEARPPQVLDVADETPAAAEVEAPSAAAVPAAAPAAPAPKESQAPTDLESAYGVLQEALRALGAPGAPVRDGEVKRKMMEIAPGFDEGKLGFQKFTRFLRQAHDAEVVDLNRQREGVYEVKLGSRKLAMPLRPTTPAPRPKAADAAPAPAPEHTPVSSAAAAPAAPEVSVPTPPAATPGVGSIRGRRGGRGAPAGPPPLLPGQVVGRTASAPGPASGSADADTAAQPSTATPVTAVESGGIAAESEAVREVAGADAEAGAGETRSSRGRRGRGRGRGRSADDTPPPLLPGQVAGGAPAATPTPDVASEPAAPAVPTAPEPGVVAEAEGEVPEAAKKRRRGGRSRKRSDAPVEGAAESGGTDAESFSEAVVAAEVALPAAEPDVPTEAPPAEAGAAKKRRGRGGRKPANRDAADDAAQPAPAAEAEPTPPAAPAFSAERLGLPTGREEIGAYVTSAFKGVGAKTAGPLVEAFGADLFRVMQEEPERVRELLGDRRAGTVLDQWSADFERRSETVASEASDTDAGDTGDGGEGGAARAARRSRSRRGGRGRSTKRKEPPAS